MGVAFVCESSPIILCLVVLVVREWEEKGKAQGKRDQNISLDVFGKKRRREHYYDREIYIILVIF